MVHSSANENMSWDNEAIKAVKEALDNATYDGVKHIIILHATEEHEPDVVCKNIEELKRALNTIYDVQFDANVPYDSGEAVFEGDSVGCVGDLIAEKNLEEFFTKA